MEGIDQRITLFINSFYSPWSDPFWAFMSQIKIWFPMYALIVALFIWKLGWKKGLILVACIALAFFFNERVNNLIKDLVERVRPCNDPKMIAAGIHILEEGGGWSFPSGHACNSFGFAICSALCLRFGLGRRSGNGDLLTTKRCGNGDLLTTERSGMDDLLTTERSGKDDMLDTEHSGKDDLLTTERSGKNSGVPKWAALYSAFIITWATLVAISRIMVARHFFGDVLVGAAMGSAMGVLWAWIGKKICTKLAL